MTSRAKSTFEQRVEWLREHPEIAKLPKPQIVKALKKAGLVAVTTYWADVRLPKPWERVT